MIPKTRAEWPRRCWKDKQLFYFVCWSYLFLSTPCLKRATKEVYGRMNTHLSCCPCCFFNYCLVFYFVRNTTRTVRWQIAAALLLLSSEQLSRLLFVCFFQRVLATIQQSERKRRSTEEPAGVWCLLVGWKDTEGKKKEGTAADPFFPFWPTLQKEKEKTQTNKRGRPSAKSNRVAVVECARKHNTDEGKDDCTHTHYLSLTLSRTYKKKKRDSLCLLLYCNKRQFVVVDTLKKQQRNSRQRVG